MSSTSHAHAGQHAFARAGDDPAPGPTPPSGRRLTPEQLEIVERLTKLATLLDARFKIPGLNARFGLDGLIGLVPGVGDALTLGLSAYIVWEAQKLGVSRATTARMVANLAIDAAVGAVPVAGDLFDVAFKANLRNLRLIGIHPRQPDAR